MTGCPPGEDTWLCRATDSGGSRWGLGFGGLEFRVSFFFFGGGGGIRSVHSGLMGLEFRGRISSG